MFICILYIYIYISVCSHKHMTNYIHVYHLSLVYLSTNLKMFINVVYVRKYAYTFVPVEGKIDIYHIYTYIFIHVYMCIHIYVDLFT